MPDPAPTASCPICGKPAAPGRLRPFCSPRCAQVDLGRWFTGAYAIPVEGDDGEDDETDAAPHHGST